ncbi:response regulator [Candidatus Saccharibacteria bacterium]|nr:response regulator [Candidatus Saccharibacteria bacterium]
MNKNKTVLLVEDDATLSDAFGIMLTKAGYDVTHAANGKDALDILKNIQPAIILLDLLMPIMDGKDFLRQFKNTHNIPVIVFSNLDSKDDVNEVLELGATRYMLKAWATPDEIIKIVEDNS